MKKYIIFLLVLSAPLVSHARTTAEALNVFNSDELAGFSEWFSRAEISAEGYLRLYSTDGYNALDDSKQEEIMANVFNAWSKSMDADLSSKSSFAEVVFPEGTALWRYSGLENSPAEIVDRWSMDRPMGAVSVPGQKRGPVFFYIGGLAYMNYLVEPIVLNMGASLNIRLGTFLLNRMFDTALTLNTGVTAQLFDIEQDMAVGTFDSYGIMGRAHLPITEGFFLTLGGQWNISPESSFNTLVGFEIPTSAGMIDVSVSSVGSLSAGLNILF